MFWRKRGQKKKRAVKDIPRGPGALWLYMVRQHGVKGEEVMHWRRVESDGVLRGKPVTMIRIFDPATAKKKGVAIEDYEGLDSHPELILYEGYYRQLGLQVTDIHIEKK